MEKFISPFEEEEKWKKENDRKMQLIIEKDKKEADRRTQLLERINSGEVSMEMAELCAYLGSKTAVYALKFEPISKRKALWDKPEPHKDNLDIGDLFKIEHNSLGEHLERMRFVDFKEKEEAIARIGVALARKALPIFEEKYPDKDLPRLAIETAEDWIAAPDEEKVAAYKLAQETRKEAYNLAAKLKAIEEDKIADSASAAASALGSIGPGLSDPEAAFNSACGALRGPKGYITELKKSVLEEIEPWVIDGKDPVKDRVAKRSNSED